MTLGNELSEFKIEVSFSLFFFFPEVHLFGSYRPEPHHLAGFHLTYMHAKDART